MSALEVVTIESEAFGQNGYLVRRVGADAALAIDPGIDAQAFVAGLRRWDCRLAAILNTHGHYDHIAGNAVLKAEWPAAPLIIGINEVHLLTDPLANLSGYWGLDLRSPPADRTVAEGERLEVAGIAFEVIEIPGHSPGSLAFVVADHVPPLAFVGDILFAGSVGRTDFPGGSGRTLLAGIAAKLLTRPDETIVYPGHGPATTIGAERATNPFLRPSG